MLIILLFVGMITSLLVNRSTETIDGIRLVSTDLENLQKSGNLKYKSESQGICLKVQRKCHKKPKIRESQIILLREIRF